MLFYSEILVTGASGYLGCHIVYQLLRKGYRVRASVRDLSDKDTTKKLRNLCPTAKFELKLVQADLQDLEALQKHVTAICYNSIYINFQLHQFNLHQFTSIYINFFNLHQFTFNLHQLHQFFRNIKNGPKFVFKFIREGFQNLVSGSGGSIGGLLKLEICITLKVRYSVSQIQKLPSKVKICIMMFHLKFPQFKKLPPQNENKMTWIGHWLGENNVEFFRWLYYLKLSLYRAVEGCTHVIHTASLLPTMTAQNKEDEDEYTRQSSEGTLALLSSCQTHRIKRFILTSCSTVIHGNL